MQHYYLTNYWGTRSIQRSRGAGLFSSGLLEKLPRLKIFLAHGGGHLPYIMGRIHHGYIVRPECRKRFRGPHGTISGTSISIRSPMIGNPGISHSRVRKWTGADGDGLPLRYGRAGPGRLRWQPLYPGGGQEEDPG